MITSSPVFSRVPSNPAAAAAGDCLRLRPRAPGCCGCPADSGGGNAGTLPVMLLVNIPYDPLIVGKGYYYIFIIFPNNILSNIICNIIADL